MKVLKPLKLGLLFRCFEYERRHYLSVAILALHRFSGSLASEVDMWKFLPEELGATGVPDAGIVKSHGEFLVSGSAYAPAGSPVRSSTVRVALGDLEKPLEVFGDRFWRMAGPSDPEPFQQMPLNWETAFGGPKYKKNPLGKGIEWVEVQDGTAQPLPNVESPREPIRNDGDRPEPAGFGPIDLTWPQRISRGGTYDDRWLEERFPGYAEDMDWRFHNLAPSDQQLDGLFRGDEPFEIEGMHPTERVQRGQLPGMVGRCFVNRKRQGVESFEDVPMRLSTVWFFPHVERFLLIHHGATEIDEDDASDVLHLMIGAEEMGVPKPDEHYRAVFDKRLDPDVGGLHALRDSDLLPAAERFGGDEDATMAEMAEMLRSENLQKENQRRKQEKVIEEQRAAIIARGEDPDAYGVVMPPPEAPLPTFDDLPEMVDRMLAEREEKMKEAEAKKAEQAEVEMPTGPPSYSAAEEITRMEAVAAKSRAAGAPQEGLERDLADPAWRQSIVETEGKVRDTYRMTAHHQPPAPRLDGEAAREAREKTRALGKALAGRDMTGFDLSGFDLQGADLRGALLENADLTGTNMAGANLGRAVLARADLTRANLSGADLSLANLGLAILESTNAEAANFTGAILEKAQLSGTVFRGGTLTKARLNEATFSGCDMSGITAPQLLFLKADVRGLRLNGAHLEQGIFIESNVGGVDFSDCHMNQAVFLTCQGADAKFDGAQMSKCVFVQDCVFDGASFARATIQLANLRGTRLAGSNFEEANLEGSDLSTCDLSSARLPRIAAEGALFMKTRLVGATLRAADLRKAVMQGADLSGADLGAANLFCADLARTRRTSTTSLLDANMAKARLVPELGATLPPRPLPWVRP